MRKEYIIFRCDVDNSTVVAVREHSLGKRVYLGVAECPDIHTAGVVLEALTLRDERERVESKQNGGTTP